MLLFSRCRLTEVNVDITGLENPVNISESRSRSLLAPSNKKRKEVKAKIKTTKGKPINTKVVAAKLSTSGTAVAAAAKQVAQQKNLSELSQSCLFFYCMFVHI
jgi:hypothetical protein